MNGKKLGRIKRSERKEWRKKKKDDNESIPQ